MKLWMTVLIGLVLGVSYSASGLSPREILQSADRSRGNLEGVTWRITISYQKRGKTDSMTLDVKARGFDVVTETVAPANHKGNKLIMLNGNMWFYKPGLSKPVPISKRQKLMGNAAYGDIAATNYADDYDAELLEEEIIDGEPCYKFNLTAKSKTNTYDRICYWISKDRLVGVKADYYTVSGKIFKTATMKYGNGVTVAGEAIPFISDLIITDTLLGTDGTAMRFNDPVLGTLPDYLFNLNLMRR